MDAERIAEAAVLWQIRARMARVGLVVDSSALSASNRRALTALERLAADEATRPAPIRPPLGFAYPAASDTKVGVAEPPGRAVSPTFATPDGSPRMSG